MKTTTRLILLTFCFIFASSIQANIINGDFATCDFTGWQKDTDGAGDTSTGGDFGIVNNAGDCSAAINVDRFDPAGDVFGTPIDQAFFANTLFQELDFSAAASSTFLLEMDFSVDSELNSSDPFYIADYFSVGLHDGAGNFFDETGGLGFLFDATDIDGFESHVLSFEIDNSFVNQTGWLLEFQLGIGVDSFNLPDAFGSSLLLNSVSLTEVPQSVSEPAASWLLSLGFIGLLIRKKPKV